ncbi:MAG: hypothetical protein K2X86_03865 [Cytophagaceae bacterium]|nr:hypothetical protein [Cytophagaceae bacterium]
MKSLIYIQIIEKINFTYNHHSITEIKALYPDLEVFDIDNFSEPSIIQHAIDLLSGSEKALIFIEATANINPNKIYLLAEHIIKHKEKYIVILKGQNDLIQKIFRLLEKKFFNNPDTGNLQTILQEHF